MPTTALYPSRIGMLDGWRGLAALAVLLQHVGVGAIGVPAVMLFFVISGYCIAASADSCLRRGVPLREFVRRRIRRIYPPYLFSLGFYLMTRVGKSALSAEENDLARHPSDYLQNLTLTQWLTLLREPKPAAYDNPTLFVTSYWSLCYEEQFYLIVAGLLVVSRALKQSLFWWLAGLALLAMCWNLGVPRLCYGLFIEYWLHFALGALVFYRLCHFESRLGRRASDACLLAVAAYSGWMSWRLGFSWEAGRLTYNELLVASLFALLLVASRPLDDRFNASLLGKTLKLLGLISFSLYLVHQFNMIAIKHLVGAILPPSLGYLQIGGEVICHFALATGFWWLCERPFLNVQRPTAAV